MALPFDQAHELLVHFCNVYQMEKSKMHILLTELQSNQKNTRSMFSEREVTKNALRKRQNRINKFGQNGDMIYVIGLMVPWVDTDKNLI